jgi:hypothetical protein
MWGRSGGMMDLEFKNNAKDSTLVAFRAAPKAGELDELKRLRARGCYVVGMGPRSVPDVSGAVAACDAWIDTGDADVGASSPAAGCLSDVIHGWCFTAELVGALTRRGKMPTMWKGWAWDDGKAWTDRYAGKRLHDDLTVPPVPAGELDRRFIGQVRSGLSRLKITQEAKLVEAARLVAEEHRAGRKTVVAWSGHVGYGMPRPFERPWSTVLELAPGHAPMRDAFRTTTLDGALVLRLGAQGQDPQEAAMMRARHQRVIHCAGDHPDATFRPAATDTNASTIDLNFAFGDACVSIDGYPIRAFPPSGIMHLAAFGAIDAGVAGESAP